MCANKCSKQCFTCSEDESCDLKNMDKDYTLETLVQKRENIEKLLLIVWKMGMDAGEVGMPSFNMAKTDGELKNIINTIIRQTL